MIWKPIPSCPGYEASNCGKIRSLKRLVTRSNGRDHTVPARELALHPDTNGYLQFRAYNTGNKKMVMVSRAVYGAHKEPLSSDLDIDHIDNNPLNNHISNLQALKRSEHGPITIQRIREKAFNEGYAQALKDFNVNKE